MEGTNPSLRAEAAELTAEAESEPEKLQQELQNKKGNTILLNMTVARLRSALLSLITNADTLSSEKEIQQKGWNDGYFLRGRT